MNKPSASTTTVVRIHVFPSLARPMLGRISAGRTAAAAVGEHCRDVHHLARTQGLKWPTRSSLQLATKDMYPLHSQSVQMVCHAFLANIDTTAQLRSNGYSKMRYPYKDKRYYPLLWPAQAVAVQGNHIVLPMGRGRESIVLPKPSGFVSGACKLVWNGVANELHVSVEVPVAESCESDVVATVDLGQIHQCAVTTNTGAALIVSGRGQRSLKRQRNKMHGAVAKLQSRCVKGSRRYKKLARTRHRLAGRNERRERDLAHKGTCAVAEFCATQQVAQVFIGDPHGVRRRNNGRKHNQRMAQWEYGRDKSYLKQKLYRKGISSFTGSERGTSSRCPKCGHKHKPKGREWNCKACGFNGHRDLVGSVNMHEDNFVKLDEFPSLSETTYLRPGSTSVELAARMKTWQPGSSSRPDTGHRISGCISVPVLLFEAVLDTTCSATPNKAPSGAGHRHRQSTEAHPL